MHRVSIDVFGARVELAGDSEEAILAVRNGLPRWREATGGAPDAQCRFERVDGSSVRLTGAGVAAPFTGSVEAVSREALSRLHFEIARSARAAVFLHAAAVVVEDRLFLFPGRSGHGKSTLAAALAAAGSGYFSDEYAPVDAEGRVWPYRREAFLRTDAAARLAAPRPMGPEPEPRRCDFVLGVRYVPGAAWRPRRLSQGEAALLLIDNAVPARLRGRDTASAIARLLAGRPLALVGDRPEFERFVPELLALARGSFTEANESRAPLGR